MIRTIMTTAPRPVCTLGRSYASFTDASLEPIVYAEPESTTTEALTKWNQKTLGAWHNWRHAVEDSLLSTDWDYLPASHHDFQIN